jgi:hypothetical protein
MEVVEEEEEEEEEEEGYTHSRTTPRRQTPMLH